jgi:predicted dehydrogenase
MAFSHECISILFETSNGARGALTVSQVSAGHKNQVQWEINGTAASLGWQGENPNELWVGRRSGPNETIAKDPSLMHADVRGVASYPGGHAEGYPDTFKQLFKAVYQYIAQGDFAAPAPFPTFEDGHAEIVLCDALLTKRDRAHWTTVG